MNQDFHKKIELKSSLLENSVYNMIDSYQHEEYFERYFNSAIRELMEIYTELKEENKKRKKGE